MGEAKRSTKRLIVFHMPKETVSEEPWPKLQKGPKEKWIKVDWKKYEDPDGPEKKGDFDLGGMNDWTGDGGYSDEEEDEEPPPPLAAEEDKKDTMEVEESAKEAGKVADAAKEE